MGACSIAVFSRAERLACNWSGNRGRDLALNREYISKVAVISLSPERPIGGHIDQLSVDAHPIARSLDGSFHDTRNTELLADLAQIPR